MGVAALPHALFSGFFQAKALSLNGFELSKTIQVEEISRLCQTDDMDSAIQLVLSIQKSQHA